MTTTQSAPVEPDIYAEATFGSSPAYSAHMLATAPIPAVPWLIEGVLPKGLSVLAGDPKAGKSLLTLEVARAVATGDAAFGNFPVRAPGEVLFLALDDPQGVVMQRLRSPAMTGITQGTRLAVVFQCDRQESDGSFPALERWLLTHPDTSLVVVDVYASVRPVDLGSRREGGFFADYNLGQPLKRLAEDHGIALVVNHHTRKMPHEDWLHRISGTFGIAAVADNLFLLDAQDKRRAMLRGRGKQFAELGVALERDESGHWRYTGEAILGGVETAVYKAVKASLIPIRPSEIEKATGLPNGSVKWACRALNSKGLIERDERGGYSPVTPEEAD